jgi:hypothetical protein
MALRRWRLAFASGEEEEEEGEGKVFFDDERDMLWVGEQLPNFKAFLEAARVGNGVMGVKRLAIDFDVQLLARNLRGGAGIAEILLKEFPVLEEVVLVGSERKTGKGEDWERGERRKRGWVAFVENVDGEEDAFRVTRAAELDAFKDECTREGRQGVVLRYMNFTREDPEVFEMVDKLKWLQMED